MPQPARDDWKHLHLWQIQPVRDGLIIATAIGLVWLGYRLSVVTVPMLLALALAYLFEPVVGALERGNYVGRRVSAVAILALALALVVIPAALGVSFATVQGLRVGQTLVSNTDALLNSVRHPEDESLRAALPGKVWRELRDFMVSEGATFGGPVRSPVPPTKKEEPAQGAAGEDQPRPPVPPVGAGAGEAAAEEAPPWPRTRMPRTDVAAGLELALSWARQNTEMLSRQVVSAGGGALGAAAVVVKRLAGAVFGIFLTGFFFYFFCTGYGRVASFVEGLIPDRRRERVLHLLRLMDRVIAGFVRGRVIICFLLIAYYSMAYWLIGVPAPLILGPIVGVLTLAPYAAGVGIPIAIGLMWLDPSPGLRGEWWWVIGSPLLVHGVQQLLDDYFLTPRIQGKTTDMDMPTILFASIAGGVLAGFYGLLLAIPFAACVKILLREVFWPRFRAWSQGRADDVLPISKD